jgi:rare lipoprotein A
MRASRMLRASSAAKLAAGALLVTLPTAGGILASDSAVARGAQANAKTTTEQTFSKHASDRRPARKRKISTGLLVSHFVVQRRAIASPSGSTVNVHGDLTPGEPGAEVKLIARAGRQWRTVATGRTHRNGRFLIRYRVHRVGATSLRVSFPGNRRARRTSAPVGQVVGLEPIVASWYYDAGNTACGFHATYGVANKTLPCGTKVTLSYGRRTVVATVDDRGPYIYGRSFDLNQTTARYLGMLGVGTVLVSV